MTRSARQQADSDGGARVGPSRPSPEALSLDRPTEILLDLSRLLSRGLHPSPTGIDRVEMAYARTLMRRIPERLSFSAVHPLGLHGRLPTRAVARFLDATEARWERDGASERTVVSYARAMEACWALRPRPVPRAGGPRVMIQVSPTHLDRLSTVQAKLRREAARFIVLVHDLIPISHPEYARPGGAALHQKRLQTLDRCADGLLFNSQATADALKTHAGPALLDRPHRTAPLAPGKVTERPMPDAGSPRPYFVCVGTIEPRKNHLMLLQLWRALIAEGGGAALPTLVLVGRRGWENENVVDLLERCRALDGHVQEVGRLPDKALRRLVQGATALLMPSFAEGFGLPVVEALAVGVPVIASNIPAHREAGGAVPDYLDPLDGSSWRTAILDYAAPESPRRRAQLDRLVGWTPARWDGHVETALSLADEVAAC